MSKIYKYMKKINSRHPHVLMWPAERAPNPLLPEGSRAETGTYVFFNPFCV